MALSFCFFYFLWGAVCQDTDKTATAAPPFFKSSGLQCFGVGGQIQQYNRSKVWMSSLRKLVHVFEQYYMDTAGVGQFNPKYY